MKALLRLAVIVGVAFGFSWFFLGLAPDQPDSSWYSLHDYDSARRVWPYYILLNPVKTQKCCT